MNRNKNNQERRVRKVLKIGNLLKFVFSKKNLNNIQISKDILNVKGICIEIRMQF